MPGVEPVLRPPLSDHNPRSIVSCARQQGSPIFPLDSDRQMHLSSLSSASRVGSRLRFDPENCPGRSCLYSAVCSFLFLVLQCAPPCERLATTNKVPDHGCGGRAVVPYRHFLFRRWAKGAGRADRRLPTGLQRNVPCHRPMARVVLADPASIHPTR